MRDRKCFVCGADTARALGWPGRFKDIPEGKHGVLAYCPAHEQDAIARRDAAIGKQVQQVAPERGGSVSISAASRADDQGSLF